MRPAHKPLGRVDKNHPDFYDERKMMRDTVPASRAEQMRERWQKEGLSARDKDRLSSRIKDLEEKVSSGMPTHEEMWKPTQENVAKNREWEKRWSKEIHELKAARRRLEPDNPSAGRIEYLRKQGEADKLAKWL